MVLPAVIFTNCPSVSTETAKDFNARIFYIPHLDAPSADLTLRWIDAVSEYLDDDPLILHDCGPEYQNAQVSQEWEAKGITAEPFPATAGALVNPCDNAFNAQLWVIFNHQKKRTYEDKLHAILTAYYTPSEAHIQYYYEKCGLLNTKISKEFVENLMHEGWCAGSTHKEIYDKCRIMYQTWEHKLHLAAAGKSLSTHEDPYHTMWHIWNHNYSK